MLSSSEFVTALYQSLLGREPDPEGLKTYVNALETGGYARGAIIMHFLKSAEFVAIAGAAPTLPPPRTSADDAETIQRCFLLAYSRMPNQQEIQQVVSAKSRIQASGDLGFLKATLAAFGRAEYPTPISVRFTSENLVEASVAGAGSTLTLDSSDMSVSNHIIKTGQYENHIGKVLYLFVKDGMDVVDIGANVGFYTVCFAEMVGKKGTVYSFEPNTENCRMIMLTKLRCNLSNIELFPLALSDKAGAAPFSPAIGSNGGFMTDEVDVLLHPNCIVVPTVRLDRLISPTRLDLIKIDVEGAEYLALQGARDLLTKHRPVVISELSREMISRISKVNAEEYLKFFANMNYRIYSLGASGPVLQVDNIDEFFNSWGSHLRIEDFAFVPNEHSVSLDQIRQAVIPGKANA